MGSNDYVPVFKTSANEPLSMCLTRKNYGSRQSTTLYLQRGTGSLYQQISNPEQGSLDIRIIRRGKRETSTEIYVHRDHTKAGMKRKEGKFTKGTMTVFEGSRAVKGPWLRHVEGIDSGSNALITTENHQGR